MTLTDTHHLPASDTLRKEYLAVLQALRPAVARSRLSATLGDARACHVLDAKYEPGQRATVLYRHGDRLARADVTAELLEVAPFPEDREIPGLRDAVRPGRLHEALADVEGYRGAVAPPRVRLLRYRPGKRVTLKLMPRTLRSSGQLRAGLVAKAYHDPRKAAAVAAEADWLARSSTPGALRLAPVLGYLPDLAVVVQGAVRGRDLDVLLGSPSRPLRPEAVKAVSRAGAALAALHRASLPAGRPRPVGKELARFLARADRIAAVDLEAGQVLRGLAFRLLDTADAVPPGDPGLVHGDCKPGQFLVGTAAVTILDLDHCGLADPACDVGTFVATLRQRAIRTVAPGSRDGGRVWAEALADTFLTAYASAQDLTRTEQAELRVRTRWYEGVALERKALRAFARAPRSPLPHHLVHEANHQLDRIFEERP